MKKYLMGIAVAMIFTACGNQSNKEKAEEMTPEQETVFVEEESNAVDSSLKAVSNEVEETEVKVNEILKAI